jgi:3-oxoacyl-[acyl-carrier protein] reductase
VLVNNLGIYENHDVFELNDADWQRMFDVNKHPERRAPITPLLAGHDCWQYGCILFISSEGALTAAADMTPYSATKLMQLSILRSLAERTPGINVTVNSLLPGSMRTPSVQELVKKVFPDDDFAVGKRRFIAENRLTSTIGRLIRPQEIADFAVFGCSGLARAINGAALRVDEGIYHSAV